MAKLLTIYGKPKDPKEFMRYYREVHIPIANKMKFQKYTITGNIVRYMGDNVPFFIASIDFESLEAIDAQLNSPAGKAAAADVPNYATGGVTLIAYEEEVV